MARQDALIAAQKKESETLVRKVKEIVDQMVKDGEPVTPYAVSKKTTVSKSFIYQNKEVSEYIAKFRSKNPYNSRTIDRTLQLEKELTDSEAQLNQKEKELRHYKALSLRLALHENQILKEKLNKYEELEKQGIIHIDSEKNKATTD